MTDLQEFWAQVEQVWRQGAFGVEIDRIILAIAVFLVFVFLRGLFGRFVLDVLRRLAARTRSTVDDRLVEVIEEPVRFVFLVLGLFLATRIAPLPADVDLFLERVVRSLIAFTIFWALYRCVRPLSFVFNRAAYSMGGAAMAETFKNFAVRLIRVLLVIFAAAAILQEWNFSIGAVLGGLGLVGMAVAFGAQNLISNLFGGFTIFIDRIFAEGDWIKAADVEGVVEQIGFRTTKVRRFDLALVTLPNSNLSDAAVTNFSKMTSRRIYWMIGLNYRTTTEQLQAVVKGLDDYIRSNPDFETDPAKVATLIHADSFNSSSIDIMLYCFTKTTAWGEWLEVKEKLLYFLKELVESQGASFAFPSSSIYVEQLPFGAPEQIPSRSDPRIGQAPSGPEPEPVGRTGRDRFAGSPTGPSGEEGE